MALISFLGSFALVIQPILEHQVTEVYTRFSQAAQNRQ